MLRGKKKTHITDGEYDVSNRTKQKTGKVKNKRKWK